MSLDFTLRKMLKDISEHRRPKEDLLQYYIQLRLDKSVQSYYADLARVQEVLERKEARKVLRAMSRGGAKDVQS